MDNQKNMNFWKNRNSSSSYEILTFWSGINLNNSFDDFVTFFQDLGDLLLKYGFCLELDQSEQSYKRESLLNGVFYENKQFFASEVTINETRFRYHPNYFSQVYLYERNGEIDLKNIVKVHSNNDRFIYIDDSLKVYENYEINIKPDVLDLNEFDFPITINFGKVPSMKTGKYVWELSFIVWSELWLQKLNRFCPEKRTFYSLDNSLLAYYNTPRLNSFIRDVKILVEDSNGDWHFDLEYISDEINRETALNGLPLDGKIIYQEDIEEGRVKLPRLNEIV